MSDVRDLLLASDLSDADVCALLAPYGFADPGAIDTALQRMCPALADRFALSESLPQILEACSRSADPSACLLQFERLGEAYGQRSALYHRLGHDPRALETFFTVAACSRSLADFLVINSEYLEIITNSSLLMEPRFLDELRLEASASASIFHEKEMKLDAMRRMRRREYLRIGARELTGLGAFEDIVREISDLAAALVAETLAVCHEAQPSKDDKPDPFCIIAFGKLGSRELNYSSDIDLAIVWDGPPAGSRDPATVFQEKLARAVIDALSKWSGEGRMYRVDMRLRPFGNAGPVGCSLPQFLNYYESWSEPWERQALLKARTIAGPPVLRAKLDEFIQDFAFARPMDPVSISNILTVKERSEQFRAASGDMGRQVKHGWGGIRDVEFTVQLLQLVAGNNRPEARTPATLDALKALESLGVLSGQESAILENAYIFLRQVEHRLQLADELSVQEIPSDVAKLRVLALSMGYEDSVEVAAGSAFQVEYGRITESVRKIHERLFKEFAVTESGSGVDFVQLLQDDAADASALRGYGFETPAAALKSLQDIVRGARSEPLSSEPQRRFLQDLPRLLEALAESPDPDLSLQQLERMANASGSPLSFFRSIQSSDTTLRVFARLTGVSEFLPTALVRHPEYIDMLADPSEVSVAKSAAVMFRELSARMGVETTDDGRLNALRRYRLREFLRIGVRDVAEMAPVTVTTHEISSLADACLQAGLRVASGYGTASKALPGKLSVLGMGKLGGREIHYSSDLDLVCVYEEAGTSSDAFRTFEKTVRSLLDVLSRLTAEGRGFEVDLRLRPQGNAGVLAMPLDGYVGYLQTEVQAWERQALIRARHVAGDARLGKRLLLEMEKSVWGKPLTSDDIDQLRHIKRRIESEKSKESASWIDLKRGAGGILDIEFTIQMIQLGWGGVHQRLRQPNTVKAIRAAKHEGVLLASDANVLVDAYLFMRRAENRLQMASEKPSEGIPMDEDSLQTFARRLGYPGSQAAALFQKDLLGHTQRARALHERIYFDQDFTRDAWGAPAGN